MAHVGFIGVGKVARTLGKLWHDEGYGISAVYNRTHAHAQTFADEVYSHACEGLLEVIQRADLIFLTVNDDALLSLAETLVSEDVSHNIQWSEKAFVHTSGACSLDVLEPLRACGAQVGSLHPAFPFADVETARQTLRGATFAIEASSDSLKTHLSQLVNALNGQEIVLEAGQKTRYHLALVMASNYTVVLYAIAKEMLLGLGAGDDSAVNALNRLLEGTVTNLITQGVPRALTGPLTREDIGTLQAHLDVLDTPELKILYRQLARGAYPLLKARGVPTDRIELTFIQDENNDTLNNT